ncbi:hypothetical protein [Nitratireductor sp. GCM10026969]|uniref:hypothetical protein n=1 Tax=Nitratireductor sp. GCM10026969 TaxID=3252645 RepID=UPI003623B246
MVSKPTQIVGGRLGSYRFNCGGSAFYAKGGSYVFWMPAGAEEARCVMACVVLWRVGAAASTAGDVVDIGHVDLYGIGCWSVGAPWGGEKLPTYLPSGMVGWR